MNKGLVVLLAIGMSGVSFAQGTIVFQNRNIPIAAGGTTGGGNGNGTYNVPIWGGYGIPGTGAGTLPGGVTVGLFDPSGTTMVGSTLLRTDANSQFFATSAQTLTIPGVLPGFTANLIVRAWQGASYDVARSSGLAFSEWTFTSKPLGGTPVGGLPITPPSMTGWGPEDGSGLGIYLIPEPTTVAFAGLGLGALFLARRRR